MSVDTYSTNWLIPRYGMMAHSYAERYPEMVEGLRRLYLERAAGIPWLPRDWRASVNHLHGNEGKLLLPVPVRATADDGSVNRFAVTPEQQAWWNQLAEDARQIQLAYAAQDAAKGRLLIDRALNNADFWNKAYNIATVLATPVTVIKGTAEVVGTYPKVVQGVLIGGAALLLWYFFRRKD